MRCNEDRCATGETISFPESSNPNKPRSKQVVDAGRQRPRRALMIASRSVSRIYVSEATLSFSPATVHPTSSSTPVIPVQAAVLHRLGDVQYRSLDRNYWT